MLLTQARVLLVAQGEPDVVLARRLLQSAGHDLLHVESLDEAAQRLAHGEFDLAVVADETVDSGDLERLLAAPCPSQTVAFVLLTDRANAELLRDAMRLGVTEVVARWAAEDSLVIAVDRAMRETQRQSELAMLRARVGEQAEQTLIGRSSAIARVRELVGRAAGSRATVLITGEPGTGKHAVARLVHDLSERASRPYVTVRCDESRPESLERELFGSVGSSTVPARAGLLEDARGGTVVLDEAAALSSTLRAKLAAAIATRTTTRVGGTTALSTDVRLILTSRRDDEASETTHEDLIHQFNAMPVMLPPLRERRSDIPQLVQHFRRRFAEEQGLEIETLRSEEILPLLGREWSGNVRELEHWVERSALASTSEQASSSASSDAVELSGVELKEARVTLDQLERVYILHVLAQESGHQSRAAVRLGIDRRTLYRKLKQYRTAGVELQQAG